MLINSARIILINELLIKTYPDYKNFLKTIWRRFYYISITTTNSSSRTKNCIWNLNYKIAIRALISSMIGIAIIQSLSMFSGVLMFSYYAGCDPFEANLIKSHDQILPLYVMNQVSFIPGLCGLFISGIFSAGLRYVSNP